MRLAFAMLKNSLNWLRLFLFQRLYEITKKNIFTSYTVCSGSTFHFFRLGGHYGRKIFCCYVIQWRRAQYTLISGRVVVRPDQEKSNSQIEGVGSRVQANSRSDGNTYMTTF